MQAFVRCKRDLAFRGYSSLRNYSVKCAGTVQPILEKVSTEKPIEIAKKKKKKIDVVEKCTGEELPFLIEGKKDLHEISVENSKTRQLDSLLIRLNDIRELEKNLPSVNELLDAVTLPLESTISGGGIQHAEEKKILCTISSIFGHYRDRSPLSLSSKFDEIYLRICCEGKDMKEALDILERMIKVDEGKGSQALLDSVELVLQTCEQARNCKDYLKVLHLHRQYGLMTNMRCWKTALNMCKSMDNRGADMDTAVKVLQEIRKLDSTPPRAKDYIEWLGFALTEWRSDAFFDILVEMRLAGVEPNILSLTSLERKKLDPALTVMEGIRAVGLDANFAMSAVLQSMKDSHGAKQQKLKTKDIANKSAKYNGMATKVIDWKVQPIKQILETQAAGLLVNADVYLKIKRGQVNNIQSQVKHLPIDANLVLNLRSQLQVMSVILNSPRIRRHSQHVLKKYDSGTPLFTLSKQYNFPALSMFRILMKTRGLTTTEIKHAISSSDKVVLSGRDRHQLNQAIAKDSVHSNKAFASDANYRSSSDMEKLVEDFVASKGIRFATEKLLIQEQLEQFGRKVLTPDILFLEPVIIKGKAVRWLDVKNYYGAHLTNKVMLKQQLKSYSTEWGPGAVVFSMGFSELLDIPGVVCLDSSDIPRSGYQHFVMQCKAKWYRLFNKFRLTPTLPTKLSMEVPAHVDADAPIDNNLQK